MTGVDSHYYCVLKASSAVVFISEQRKNGMGLAGPMPQHSWISYDIGRKGDFERLTLFCRFTHEKADVFIDRIAPGEERNRRFFP